MYFDDAQYDVVSGINANNFQANSPGTYELYQNYPNPFNPQTTIRYGIPAQGKVQLNVYDILGKKVVTLVDDVIEAGTHHINWDAGHLPTGVYLYRLQSQDFVQTRKLLLIK